MDGIKNTVFSHGITGTPHIFPPVLAGHGAAVAPGPAGGEAAQGAAGSEAGHPEAVPRLGESIWFLDGKKMPWLLGCQIFGLRSNLIGSPGGST